MNPMRLGDVVGNKSDGAGRGEASAEDRQGIMRAARGHFFRDAT
jgi:hypothetical protein